MLTVGVNLSVNVEETKLYLLAHMFYMLLCQITTTWEGFPYNDGALSDVTSSSVSLAHVELPYKDNAPPIKVTVGIEACQSGGQSNLIAVRVAIICTTYNIRDRGLMRGKLLQM